jgi:hypothetical protein
MQHMDQASHSNKHHPRDIHIASSVIYKIGIKLDIT